MVSQPKTVNKWQSYSFLKAIEKFRKSNQVWIPKNNKVLKKIYEKISKIIKIPVDNFEELQVVKYNKSGDLLRFIKI